MMIVKNNDYVLLIETFKSVGSGLFNKSIVHSISKDVIIIIYLRRIVHIIVGE